MPLRDHFHPPLSPPRKWESFHSLWAGVIASTLNESILPDGYYSEVQVHIGARVEVDVATLSASQSTEERDESHETSGGVAMATAPATVWAPPEPAMVMDLCFPDEVEIQVFREEGGSILVGAIELISPSNKDRLETRRAFTAKCISYLTQGVGLIIVDIVTERNANLHNEIVDLLGQSSECHFDSETGLYAIGYRPWKSDEREAVDIWPAELHLEAVLPSLPLALRDFGCLPLDLEATYSETCRKAKIPAVSELE